NEWTGTHLDASVLATACRKATRVVEVIPLDAAAPAPKALAHSAIAELDAVYRTARRLTGDDAEAEDLVQDTYLRALGTGARFEVIVMDCSEAKPLLLGRRRGTLDTERERELARHLESCEACRAEDTADRALDAALDKLPVRSAPEHLRRSLEHRYLSAAPQL